MSPADLIEEFFPDESVKFEKYYPGSKRKLADRGVTPTEYAKAPWRDNYSVKKIKGVDTRMYPIGALADALEVSVPTVRYWTRKGHMPDAPYRLPPNMRINGEKTDGRRLYSEEFIVAAIKCFVRRGLLGATRIEWKKHRDLPIEIREEWTRILNNQPQPTT